MNTPSIRTIETHTEGMPTRIVLQGVPPYQGDSMSERLNWFDQHAHAFRELLMNEPRGHSAMFGAVLLPATRPDADIGVIYMSASGFLPMCGHGTIGVATALVERGMVKVSEPVTEVRLDTPAGLVIATVQLEKGKAREVTITNVPSFVIAYDRDVQVPGVGTVKVDVAYGGNVYAIADAGALGRKLEVEQIEALQDIGLAIIAATRDQVKIEHPEMGPMRLKACILTEPATGDRPARNLMVKEPRYFDRSPCGTGTSARMAAAYRRGELTLGQPFVHQSILGTSFKGTLIEVTQVGNVPAVIPTITGRAWITGTAEFFVDPTDAFPTGFKIG